MFLMSAFELPLRRLNRAIYSCDVQLQGALVV